MQVCPKEDFLRNLIHHWPQIMCSDICDLSRKNQSYAFLISLTFNSCQAAILYTMPTSFGNQEEQWIY